MSTAPFSVIISFAIFYLLKLLSLFLDFELFYYFSPLHQTPSVELVIIGQCICRMQFASCKTFNNKMTDRYELITGPSVPLCEIHFGDLKDSGGICTT